MQKYGTAATLDESDRADMRSPAMRTLRAACAVGGLAQSLTGAAGALLALEMTGSASSAGLPQTVLVAGSALAAAIASRLAVPFGRRRTLASGAAAATAGSAVVATGALVSSLALVLGGCALLGAGTAVVMLIRYAAAEQVPESLRPKAMASVLTATTIGAVAGPNLLAPASRAAEHFDLPGLAGPFLLGGSAFALTVAMLLAGLRSAPPPVLEPAPKTEPGRFHSATTGLAVLTLSNLVMVGVMTMAPVQMSGHGGGLGLIGLVISVHIIGMFAPSALSALLVQRIGAAPTAALAGCAMAAACAFAAAAASSHWALGIAMAALGVGWNLGLVSGSAMLTASVPREVRVKREGLGEVGMGAAAAAGGLACGPLVASGGYVALAMAGAVAAALIPTLAVSATPKRPD
ncbi:MFS transporter [Glycomyces harbinensis]|uniref:Predicted arabinose efflux permease, MFS family n=1 Tax=Glycomyces harbinensis TaxID=58114 RepID=A0A1G7AR94_9ACTN|nr:MFS transporter [Glycomyces harbinensis]SDE16436.1 Predicted arabinose efflux permease, MFS family [Glycomyces harbinensis]